MHEEREREEEPLTAFCDTTTYRELFDQREQDRQRRKQMRGKHQKEQVLEAVDDER